jgi:C-terminal processing protease CtpA/Prc
MKAQRATERRHIAWPVALVIVGLLTFAAGYQSRRALPPENTDAEQSRLVARVLSLIRANYVDSLSDTELGRLAAEGIIARLHDPYSMLLDERTRRSGPNAVPDRLPRLEALALGDSIGLVRLTSIPAGAARAVRREIIRLRATGTRGLILDLRGNPGGLVGEAADIAELFLDRDSPIGRLQGRSENLSQRFVAREHQEWPDLLLVLLVDGKTASAAELVSGTLQEHDRALIIGTPTFGKGVAQTPFDLGNGLILKLTTSRWFTPRGRALDRGAVMSNGTYQSDGGRPLVAARGVTPDVIVPEGEIDAALASAVRVLVTSRTTSDLLGEGASH